MFGCLMVSPIFWNEFEDAEAYPLDSYLEILETSHAWRYLKPHK